MPSVANSAGSPLAGLVVAVLTLAIVLVVSYMCVQLFKMRHQMMHFHRGVQHREGYANWYYPACSGPWLGNRWASCTGATSGQMPAIESEEYVLTS